MTGKNTTNTESKNYNRIGRELENLLVLGHSDINQIDIVTSKLSTACHNVR